MARMSEKTLLQELQEVVPYYLANYLLWYYSDPEQRISWDELCRSDINFKSKTGENKTEDFCEQNWLPRPDVQRAMVIYLNRMKVYNEMKIYQSMLKKAINGDVNSAKYILDVNAKLDKLAKDKQETSEIAKLLEGVEIHD